MGLNGNSATATLNCVCSHIQNKSTRNSTNPVGFYMVKINPSILLVMSTSLPAQNVLAEERLRWRRGGLMKQRTKGVAAEPLLSETVCPVGVREKPYL